MAYDCPVVKVIIYSWLSCFTAADKSFNAQAIIHHLRTSKAVTTAGIRSTADRLRTLVPQPVKMMGAIINC